MYVHNAALPCLIALKGLRVIDNACFSLLTHNKKLLFVPFCDTTVGIRAVLKCDTITKGVMDGQTDVKSEIII